MAVLDHETNNLNHLSPFGYKLEIPRLPTLSRNIQLVKVPALELPPVNDGGLNTPFVSLNIPGDQLKFDDLEVKFLVDENLYAWTEAFDWLVGMGFPDNRDQYRQLLAAQGNPVQQASLILLNGTRDPTLKITFTDIAPVKLGGFEMNSTEENVRYVTSTVTFSYTSYSYSRTF